jgi:hypothetical protein
VGLYCLCSMVTMATKLFTAVNSVKLSNIELNEVKVPLLHVRLIHSVNTKSRDGCALNGTHFC